MAIKISITFREILSKVNSKRIKYFKNKLIVKSENIKILKYIDFEITNNMSKKVLYQKIKKSL